MGLQALPLHQFQYLLSHLRLTSLAYYARHRREFARSVHDSRCADTSSVLRCSLSAPGTPAMKHLMLAVLEDALRCIQTYTESPNPVHRKAFAEAETWILDRKAQGPFAFVSICEALGSSPTICARAYVSGVCICLRAEIPAACNGAACAGASLQRRWSVGG